MKWVYNKDITRREFARGGAAGAAALGLAGCAGAANTQGTNQSEGDGAPGNPSSGKVAIIYTNDTHGHDLLNNESLGFAAVAQLKADWEAKGYEVLLMDCGDAVQGEFLVGQSKGDTAIQFMNEVGYDVMALGNHEFDYGQDKINDYVSAATFPIISASVIVDETKETMVDPTTVLTLKDGRKIGVFGLTTPETYTKASPLLVKGLTFLKDDALYVCAQEQVDALKNQGCDLVVCLGHLGELDESAPNRAKDVVTHVTGIDLFIDGHDHLEEHQTIKDAAGNEVPVVEADCYTHMIGVVTWEDGKLTPELVKFGSYSGQDAEVAASVQKVADEVQKDLGEVVGTVAFELNGERAPGVRTEETNLGDFVTDAMLWEAQQNSQETPSCAIINGGAIRDSIHPGDITKGTGMDVLPFINIICTVQVTGAQLLEALEASCSDTPEEFGGFPQVANMRFSVDTAVPYEKGDEYPDSTYYAPAKPGSRVTIEEIDGAAFDAKKTYTVVATDFICAGGDTYDVFSEAAKTTLKETKHYVIDAFVTYLKDVCAGEVGTQYEQSQGRITIKGQ